LGPEIQFLGKSREREREREKKIDYEKTHEMNIAYFSCWIRRKNQKFAITQSFPTTS